MVERVKKLADKTIHYTGTIFFEIQQMVHCRHIPGKRMARGVLHFNFTECGVSRR